MLSGSRHRTFDAFRALSTRFWDVMLPASCRGVRDDTLPGDEANRSRLLVGVLLLCGFNLVFTSIVHVAIGNVEFAGSVAAILTIVGALIWAVRSRISLDFVAHATVFSIYLVSLWLAVSTGGQIAGGLFFLVLVPAVATLVLDRRAGFAWAAATLLTLVGIGAYSGPQGVEPWIELDQAGTATANLRAAGLVLLAVTAIATLYSRVQESARSELERMVAIHQAGERRFRAMTEHASDLVAEIDLKGRFIFASPGFEEALGWHPSDLLGEIALHRLHPDDFETAAAAWQVLLEKGAVRQQPVRLLNRAGQGRWFEISMRVYSTADEESRVVTIARDVSEDLEREGLLRQQHRLSSGGIMAAGTAHQLASPMASILVAAQYARELRDEPDFAERAIESLGAIEDEASRCGRILSAMLAFARDETAERWVEDLKIVLHDAARAVRSQFEEAGVELVLSLTSSDVRARVSPIEIEQVVVNLLRNAAQAGASVIVLGLDLAQDSVARITVSDDGPGLDEESASNAFRPFYTSRSGEGSGLGLTVAREIVQAHAGEIALTRSGPDGAVFRVDLPLFYVAN